MNCILFGTSSAVIFGVPSPDFVGSQCDLVCHSFSRLQRYDPRCLQQWQALTAAGGPMRHLLSRLGCSQGFPRFGSLDMGKFFWKPWKPKICGGRRIMEHLEHQSRKSLYMDKWWYMLRFLGNMNNISIFIGFSCISTHERDFTYQPHDRRNALNQDLLKDQLTGMCNTTISIWPSFKASRDVVRQELWEHLGSWNCGGHDHALKLHVQLLRHDQTVDVFSFEHAKTGPENIDVLLFSKRVASCLLSLPHLVHVHHKYHDI